MSLETGQILHDIGLCHDFTFLGAKIGSLATIPSPRTAGVCPPHARGGVGREQKGAPLPGSDVRLLRFEPGPFARVRRGLRAAR